MLFGFFINASSHYVKNRQSEFVSKTMQLLKLKLLTARVHYQVSPWCLAEVWDRPRSEMRPEWHEEEDLWWA